MDEWQEQLETICTAMVQWSNRHVREFAIIISLISVPLSFLYLAPVALAALVPPFEPADLSAPGPAALTFLDVNGRAIGRVGPVVGEHLRLEEMPTYLPAAFIAMEDRRFYGHHGLDFVGLSRAVYANLRARRVVAGGSTISQQTAKILFSGHERTWSRKGRELLKAVALEKSLSKNQILELYLNNLYLGDGAYGVDTAARTYFGVSARQVTLAEAAMLAALTRAPTVFSPHRNLRAAQQRAGRVLTAMLAAGLINPQQAAWARARPAGVVARRPDSHGYFLDAAADQARELLAGQSVAAGEVIVHTTLDSELQRTAEATATRAVEKSGRKMNFAQAAIVVMRPNGAVSAMVGGVDYQSSVFNRVTQAHRQPGSAFKPFVYLAALESGISPWDWRDDQPVEVAGYQPANYQNASYGRMRLADALARSVNTITVNLAQEVGVANVAAAARRTGIVSPLQDNASLALGTNEVTPLELTAAYNTFANGGRVAKPFLISRIDAASKIIFQRPDDVTQPVIADSVRRDLLAMLHKVVTGGTGTAAGLGAREVAGKTGTTQDYRDGWFVGFTSDYVAGVWVGNDANTPMRRVTGGSIPAQIWKDVMIAAEHDRPLVPLDRTPEPPADVENGSVLSESAYTDDIGVSASDQLPVDSRGNFVALASGVSPPGAIVSRDDNRARLPDHVSGEASPPPASASSVAIEANSTVRPEVSVARAPSQTYPQTTRVDDIRVDRAESPPTPAPAITSAPIVTH
jgi:penicillin-binding protein 1A